MYSPLYTSINVLDEPAILILSHRAHGVVAAEVERVGNSATIVVHSVEEDFDAICEQFADYQGQEISFTDHTSGVFADERAIEHLFTFDADHFRTLGFTVVPADTDDP